MESMRGGPRLLTDAQVQVILSWWPKRVDWKARRAALLRQKRELAAALNVDHHAIDRAIARGVDYRLPQPANRRRGRPPLIHKPEHLAAVHAWHTQWLALHEELHEIKPLDELALDLGVACSTIQHAIAIGGLYKQVSPDRLNEMRSRREHRLARMRALFLY